MVYTRKNKGVCSSSTTVEIEDGIIQSISVKGGCAGNLSGISSLLVGMAAKDVAGRMKEIRCGSKKTSCPAQISECIEEALQKSN